MAEKLRIGLIAGTLGQGGAEKQYYYVARAIHQAGASLKIACLTRGEQWESNLTEIGFTPVWVGRSANPLLRLVSIVRAFSPYHPHILHSTHFFTNLYAALAARWLGAVSIGSIRNDTQASIQDNPVFGRWLFRLPDHMVVNSISAYDGAIREGLSAERVSYLPNCIDLEDFDRRFRNDPALIPNSDWLLSKVEAKPHSVGMIAILVARLVRFKRIDIYLRALAEARRAFPGIQGVIAGDGPERSSLESLASDLGLLPGGVLFLGSRKDVPSLLCQASMIILTSEYEGFPNSLLEGMAARLPAIVTPAGDAGRLVKNGVNGFVVSHTPKVDMEDALVSQVASRMVDLAASADLRRSMGEASRRQVEEMYGFEKLPERIMDIYRSAGKQVRGQVWGHAS